MEIETWKTHFQLGCVKTVIPLATPEHQLLKSWFCPYAGNYNSFQTIRHRYFALQTHIRLKCHEKNFQVFKNWLSSERDWGGN